MTMEPWIVVNSPVGPIHVVKVDEDEIEESGLEPDFVEGTNWLHSSWLPDHYIALAKGLWKLGQLKVMKTFVHEFAESLAEARRAPYEKAHAKVANPSETKAARILRGTDG